MAIKRNSFGFPKIGSIKLGSQKGEKTPGRNLPGFRLVSLDISAMEEANSVFGEQPKELRIHFPRIPDITEEKAITYIYDDAYEAYKNGSLFCRGDGETATRAVKKGVQETVSCVCELSQGDKPLCKPRGVMRVVLSQLPPRGIWILGTSSWNSISNMRSVIEMYHSMLGKTFWKTQFILYKEEMILQGRRQYITKLKIAPEFLLNMPKGAEAFSANLINFDDEEIDEDGEPVSRPKPEEERNESPPVQTVAQEPERPIMENPVPTPEIPTAEEEIQPVQPAEEPAPLVDAPPSEVPVAEIPSVAPRPSQPVRNEVKSAMRRARETSIKENIAEIQRLSGDNFTKEELLAMYTGYSTLDEIPEKEIQEALIKVSKAKLSAKLESEKKKSVNAISSSDLIFDENIPF